MNYEIAGYEDKEVRIGDVWKDGYGKQWKISEFFSNYKEKGITYCLSARDAIEELENFTIKGYLLQNSPTTKENLVTYVGNVNDSDVPSQLEVPYEDEHAQDVPEPEDVPKPEPKPKPEPVFSQDLSEPYGYETDEDSIADATRYLHRQPVINHNGEYYIKQAIHIYVDSDDLDRARILIKALKHIKEI